MEKITLKSLFKDTFRRSALISIPDISELLVVPGSMFTKWEVFYTIVKDAVQKFDYYFPLCITQKTYLSVDSGTRKVKLQDNFKSYIKGIIDEDSIFILPTAVAGISTSYYTVTTYPLRDYRYENGEFTDFWYSSNVFYIVSICSHPLYEEYEEVSKEPTDNCAVYYMSEHFGSRYTIFRDEVYLSVCRYIMNLRKNMMLQNMPIELFGGLETDYQELNQKQEQIYQQGSNSAYWTC